MNPESLAEDRHEEAVKFLAQIFSVSETAPLLRRDLRHWKYYAPHPFTTGSRSYVFRDAKGLIAHGGLAPVQFDTLSGPKSSFQFIDWAAGTGSAGAGFLLFRALWPMADSYLGIGGSDDARKVMKRVPNMKTVQPMAHFAYPLRPFGQLLASRFTWKSPLKWLRAWRWHSARKRPNLSAWKAVPVARLTNSDAPLLIPADRVDYTPLRRTPELVNYWLACPAGKIRAWRLEHNGAAAGILVLAFLNKEARIVDVVLSAPNAPLSEAYSLAIDLAARESDACELSAASSAPPQFRALTAAGFIIRGHSDVFLGDPRKHFPPDVPIEANLTIGDGFYQQSERPYFHTF
jgi:hypothetical protein